MQDKLIVKEWSLDNFKVRDLEFSHDIKYFVFGKQDKFEHRIELWNIDQLNLISSYDLSQYGGTELEFSTDDETLVVSLGMQMGGHSFLLLTKDFVIGNNNYYSSGCSRFTLNDDLFLVCVPDDYNPSIHFYNTKEMLSEQ